MRFVTGYAYPWALVLWGGQAPGKRPSTRVGFIKEAIATDGTVIGFRVFTRAWNNPGGWTKRARFFASGEIVKTWRHQPSNKAVQQAKRRLKAWRAGCPMSNNHTFCRTYLSRCYPDQRSTRLGHGRAAGTRSSTDPQGSSGAVGAAAFGTLRPRDG